MCLILYNNIIYDDIVNLLAGGPRDPPPPSHLPLEISTVITFLYYYTHSYIVVVFLEMSHVAHCVHLVYYNIAWSFP